MVFKNLYVLVLWTKVATALEELMSYEGSSIKMNLLMKDISGKNCMVLLY